MEDFNLELVGSGSIASALKESGAKTQKDNNVYFVPFDKLVILSDFNVREHDKNWEERVNAMSSDMETNGYQQDRPMTIFVDSDNRIIVTDGHTRYESMQRARARGAKNLDLVPVIARQKGTSMEDLTISLVKSNSGEKLSPLGLSLVVKRLMTTYAKDQGEIAKLLSFTPAYINFLQTLAGAPNSIREMIKDGKVSATFAVETLRKEGANAAQVLEEALEKAEKDGKTKVRKKAVKTREDKVSDAQKKHAALAFQLIELLIDGDTGLTKDLKDRFEAVLFQVEQAGEEE